MQSPSELTLTLQLKIGHGRSLGAPPSRIIAACVRAFDQLMDSKTAGMQAAGPQWGGPLKVGLKKSQLECSLARYRTGVA